MSRSARLLLGVGGVACAAVLSFAPLRSVEFAHGRSGLAARLLGPIAGLAASAQWVRADLAFREGRIELFLARAQTALALAPESAAGWDYLAWHQAYNLGSPEREPDPERRLAWVRAGLATAAAGERVVSRPEELAQAAGLILVKVASLDPSLPWPGDMAAAWEEAAVHFERALSLGADSDWMLALIQSSRKQAAELTAGH